MRFVYFKLSVLAAICANTCMSLIIWAELCYLLISKFNPRVNTINSLLEQLFFIRFYDMQGSTYFTLQLAIYWWGGTYKHVLNRMGQGTALISFRICQYLQTRQPIRLNHGIKQSTMLTKISYGKWTIIRK